MRDALGSELHFLLNVNGNPSVVGGGPVANSGYAGQCAAPRAESICRFGDVSVAISGATDIFTDTRRPLLGYLLRRAFHCVRLAIAFFHRRACIVKLPVVR